MYPKHIGCIYSFTQDSPSFTPPFPAIWEIRGIGGGGGGGASFTTWQYDGQGGFGGYPTINIVYIRENASGVNIQAGGAGGGIDGDTANQRGKPADNTFDASSAMGVGAGSAGQGGSAGIEMTFNDASPHSNGDYPFLPRNVPQMQFLGRFKNTTSFSGQGNGGSGAVKAGSFEASKPGSSGSSGRIDIICKG